MSEYDEYRSPSIVYHSIIWNPGRIINSETCFAFVGKTDATFHLFPYAVMKDIFRGFFFFLSIVTVRILMMVPTVFSQLFSDIQNGIFHCVF